MTSTAFFLYCLIFDSTVLRARCRASQIKAGRLEAGRLGVRPIVRREEGVGLQWVQFPPGNWVAPAGSYRGGGGGNEIVGAFETDVSPWRCSEPTGRNASER